MTIPYAVTSMAGTAGGAAPFAAVPGPTVAALSPYPSEPPRADDDATGGLLRAAARCKRHARRLLRRSPEAAEDRASSIAWANSATSWHIGVLS
jgi:hypothetical protein